MLLIINVLLAQYFVSCVLLKIIVPDAIKDFIYLRRIV